MFIIVDSSVLHKNHYQRAKAPVVLKIELPTRRFYQIYAVTSIQSYTSIKTELNSEEIELKLEQHHRTELNIHI